MVDVARHAGVAPSTVSYVINHTKPVTEATRERVERSIRELGFSPHAGASSIRRQTTNVLALVLPALEESLVPAQMGFVARILAAARARDYDLMLLADGDGSQARRVVDGSMVDGVIAMDVTLDDARVSTLEHLSRPVVMIGTLDDAASIVHVDLDFATAGKRCVDYLASLGHLHVAYLGQPQVAFERQAAHAILARDGALGAMKARGMSPNWAPTESTRAGVEAAIERLLGRDPHLSAIVVYNEVVLQLVVHRFAELGWNVPTQLSVVAICPDRDAQLLNPAVTNVTLPVDELCDLAMARLFALIGGEEPPARTLIEPQLRARGSVLPLRQSGWRGP